MDPATSATASGLTAIRQAATLAWISAGLFIALLALLHPLRPDLEPSWRVISEYALGAYGWLMTLAFAALAVACVALAVAIRRWIRGVAATLGWLCLGLTAVGLGLAAVFPTDPITTAAAARTTAGRLHETGAMLDLIPIGAVLLTWRLGRDAAWRPARRALLTLTLAQWAAEVWFIATLAITLPRNQGQMGPEVPIGWPGRLSIVLQAAWLMLAAAHARRIARRGPSADPGASLTATV